MCWAECGRSAGTGCLHGGGLGRSILAMAATNFSQGNSGYCEKRAEGAEGDLGCLSFCQENKDVIQYFVLARAWQVTLFMSIVLGSPRRGIHARSRARFHKGDEKVLSNVAGTRGSPTPPKPVGSAAPLPMPGSSHQDPSKPGLQAEHASTFAALRKPFFATKASLALVLTGARGSV